MDYIEAPFLSAKTVVRKDVTIEDLEQALEVAAFLCELHGELYMPYFLYVEDALKDMRSQQTEMDRVRSVANRIRRQSAGANPFSFQA